MGRYPIIAILAVFSLLAGPAPGAGAGAPGALAAPVAVQSTLEPLVLLSGLHLADGVRYSVALVRPDELALRDVRVELQLPADAELLGALETPGYTRFLGDQGGRLAWAAPEFVPGDYVDAFTFTLRQAPAGELVVRVSWAGEQPGQALFTGQPPVLDARAPAGELMLGSPDRASLLPVAGSSGVLLLPTAAGAVPEGTTVRVRQLGPEANPPDALGDLWWCAMLEVAGLPEGAELLVFAPARRPLPPAAEVTLFAQREGRWEPLPEGGRATFTGQHVLFRLAGNGTVAAGTNPRLRSGSPVPTEAGTTTTTPGTPTTPRRPTNPGAPIPLLPNPSDAEVERDLQRILAARGIMERIRDFLNRHRNESGQTIIQSLCDTYAFNRREFHATITSDERALSAAATFYFNRCIRFFEGLGLA